jgi:hypothetical protein
MFAGCHEGVCVEIGKRQPEFHGFAEHGPGHFGGAATIQRVAVK